MKRGKYQHSHYEIIDVSDLFSEKVHGLGLKYTYNFKMASTTN